MKSILYLVLCAITGVTVTPAVKPPPSTEDATPQLWRDARCLLRVLKTVRRIDSIEMRASNSGGWSHPYLQYRAKAEPDGTRSTARFEATKNFYSSADRKPYFVAAFSGLTSPGEEPRTYGAGAVAALFEKRCQVHAMILFP